MQDIAAGKMTRDSRFKGGHRLRFKVNFVQMLADPKCYFDFIPKRNIEINRKQALRRGLRSCSVYRAYNELMSKVVKSCQR